MSWCGDPTTRYVENSKTPPNCDFLKVVASPKGRIHSRSTCSMCPGGAGGMWAVKKLFGTCRWARLSTPWQWLGYGFLVLGYMVYLKRLCKHHVDCVNIICKRVRPKLDCIVRCFWSFQNCFETESLLQVQPHARPLDSRLLIGFLRDIILIWPRNRLRAAGIHGLQKPSLCFKTFLGDANISNAMSTSADRHLRLLRSPKGSMCFWQWLIWIKSAYPTLFNIHIRPHCDDLNEIRLGWFGLWKYKQWVKTSEPWVKLFKFSAAHCRACLIRSLAGLIHVSSRHLKTPFINVDYLSAT